MMTETEALTQEQAEGHAAWLATPKWGVVDTRESSISTGSFFYGPTTSEYDAITVAQAGNARNIYGPCYVVVQLVPAT